MLVRVLRERTASLFAVRFASTNASSRNPVDYERWMSVISRRREPSAIRVLEPLLRIPGMTSLATGSPNPTTFPFGEITYSLRSGERFVIKDEDLNEMLSYTASRGYAPLVAQVERIVARDHAPPAIPCGRSVLVTNGSQEGLSKAFDMVLERDAPVLVENPCYSGALAALRPITSNITSVDVDANGLVPESLERALAAHPAGHFRMLYTIPTGQNPSGATLSVERRMKLYNIACRHNLLLFEDDPYYYLRFSDAPLPSLSSMDTEGRVLRFDSLSKVVSSGLRVGWVSGPTPLVDRMLLHMQASSIHPPVISQRMVADVLATWGDAGFDEHVRSVRAFYGAQRAAFLESAERHMRHLADFSAPEAGFFVWFKVRNIKGSAGELVMREATQAKVLLVPGDAFEVHRRPSNALRACFSVASPAKMDEALRKLRGILERVTASSSS